MKQEDFKVNVKEKIVLKAASLLFKIMWFLSKFVYVFYAKIGWQSTQQIKIHPVLPDRLGLYSRLSVTPQTTVRSVNLFGVGFESSI